MANVIMFDAFPIYKVKSVSPDIPRYILIRGIFPNQVSWWESGKIVANSQLWTIWETTFAATAIAVFFMKLVVRKRNLSIQLSLLLNVKTWINCQVGLIFLTAVVAASRSSSRSVYDTIHQARNGRSISEMIERKRLSSQIPIEDDLNSNLVLSMFMLYREEERGPSELNWQCLVVNLITIEIMKQFILKISNNWH